MSTRLRGHPLSPLEDPSSNPTPPASAHADLYRGAHDAHDPLFSNSPPLESPGAEMQCTLSQVARTEHLTNESTSPSQGSAGAGGQKSMQAITTAAQRAPTPSSIPSRVASPLASPSAPSAYAAFSDPFSSPATTPPRISFPAPPHRLPREDLTPLPLAHLVALVQALSRDLDDAQASLRSQRAELAALDRLVRDKGASEGEIERAKVRARTEEGGNGDEQDGVAVVKAGRRSATGGKAADEWSIDLPSLSSQLETTETLPPKTEVDLDIDDLTEAISSNAFDLGLRPSSMAADAETASIRSRAFSLPGESEESVARIADEGDPVSPALPIPSAKPGSASKMSSSKSTRPRHASLSARFVGYIAGAPPSTSPTASAASVVSPKKLPDDPSSVGTRAPSDQKKRPRSGSIRSISSVASSVTSGGGGGGSERKGYGESSWLSGWRWGKSSSLHTGGAATSSLREASGAEAEEGAGAGEPDGDNNDRERDATTPFAAPRSDADAPTSPAPVADDAVQTPHCARSRSSSTSSTTSPSEQESGQRSRPSSRRTSQTARSTLDTTLPGSSPPPPMTPADKCATESGLDGDRTDRSLLSPPESPSLTRRRSLAPPPNFQPSAQQSTAAAVLSTPLTASTISLPSASPNRLTGYGGAGPSAPTSPARSPPSNLVQNPVPLPEVGESPPTTAENADARHRFVPGVPLYSAQGSPASMTTTATASDRLVASAKGTINRALLGRPDFSRHSSHSSHSTSSAEAFNSLLNTLPAKLPPLSLARYSPFSQPALSMPATHVSLSASTASLTTAVAGSAGPTGSPLVAHTAVLAPASAASGAQTMELDTISAEAAPPSLALLKPSYQSAAAAAGVGVGAGAGDGAGFEDDDGPMIDRFGFIYDVHTGMALLKESRRRKAGEQAADTNVADAGEDVAPILAAAAPVATVETEEEENAEEGKRSDQSQLGVSGIPAVMTTPQTELEVHPQLDALREAIGLTPTVEAENTLSPPTSSDELPTRLDSPTPAVPDPESHPAKLVRAPSSTADSPRQAPLPNGTGPQSMRALLVQLRTMTDALEQSQQAAWDSFIRRRQRKLAKLKQTQIDDHHHQYHEDGKAPTVRGERERGRRGKPVFLADELEPADHSIEQDVWTSENLVGVAQMGTEKKGKKEDWNEFKELVRKGIPIAYRPKIWGECSSANEAREPGVYQELLAQPTTDDEAPCLKQIDMDCHRTFPTNVFFAGNGPGVAKLRNVLVAYSRRDPKVGYCQGMNNLVATLLLTHPAEEDAFWVLVCIIENILPSDYYTSHLLVSRADQQVLKDLVDRILPKLSVHLEEQGVELSAITFGWFLSLFTDCLPIQTLLRVWDLFFIHGTIFLFRVALAILKLHESELLACDSAAGLYAMLGQLPAGLWNADRLLKVACDDLASAVKDRDVATLRNRHVTALEAEMDLGGNDDLS
ncbi:hypothetical protein JCM3774_001818 [Rhodotorula dairenensis]